MALLTTTACRSWTVTQHRPASLPSRSFSSNRMGPSTTWKLPARAVSLARCTQPLQAQLTPGTMPTRRMQLLSESTGVGVIKRLPLGSIINRAPKPPKMPLNALSLSSAAGQSNSTDSGHHQDVGTSADWPWKKAGEVLTDIGVSAVKAAWILKVEPDLASLDADEVRARFYAAKAAFGGKLSAADIGTRLAAAPAILTLEPSDIAASHSRLAELGLTAGEAATVLAAQPRLLLSSKDALCLVAENLQVSFSLSPRRLRDLIVEMPECLWWDCMRGVPDEPRYALKNLVVNSMGDSSYEQLEHILESTR